MSAEGTLPLSTVWRVRYCFDCGRNQPTGQSDGGRQRAHHDCEDWPPQEARWEQEKVAGVSRVRRKTRFELDDVIAGNHET